MNSRKMFWLLPILVFSASVLFTAYRSDKADENIVKPLTPQKDEMFQKVTPPPVPRQVFFAGEEVPLNRFDVFERFDRELIVNCYFHSQTLRLLKMAPRYFNIIEPILKSYNIPDDFKYLAVAESGLDPRALSPAGAAGIWQLMKGTARDYALEVNDEVDERYHIEKASVAACKYLLESYIKYGDWTTVAASYNAGRNGIDRQVERQKETHYFDLLLTEETNRYVFRILVLKTILESPVEYGFQVDKKDRYPELKCKTIEVNTSIADFADFAKLHGVNYKILKDMNPWLRDTKLTVSGAKVYEIKILNEKYLER